MRYDEFIYQNHTFNDVVATELELNLSYSAKVTELVVYAMLGLNNTYQYYLYQKRTQRWYSPR